VDDHVFPVVAEVVCVRRGRCVPRSRIEVFRHANVPAGNDRTILRIFVGRDPNRHQCLLLGVHQPELVQVVVEPTHGVLNGDVQVPERVVLRDLNPSPHHGVRAGEDD
jgi:hypothetical protein